MLQILSDKNSRKNYRKRQNLWILKSKTDFMVTILILNATELRGSSDWVSDSQAYQTCHFLLSWACDKGRALWASRWSLQVLLFWASALLSWNASFSLRKWIGCVTILVLLYDKWNCFWFRRISGICEQKYLDLGSWAQGKFETICRNVFQNIVLYFSVNNRYKCISLIFIWIFGFQVKMQDEID